MVEKKKIRLTPKLKAAALEYKEQLEQMVKDLNDVAKDVIPELEKNYNVECRAHSGRPDKISLYRGNISGSYQLYATGDDAEMNINDASSILVEELENELHKSKINATVNTKFPVTWADAAVYVSINVIPPSEDIYNAMVAIVDKEEDKRVKELRKRSRYSWGYDESTKWRGINVKWYRINESAVHSAMGTVIGLGKSLGNSDLKTDTKYKTNKKTWALDKSHMPFDSISKVLSRLSTEKYQWEYIESQKAFYLKKTFNTSKVKSLFSAGRTNIENECRTIYRNTRKELTNFIDSNPELNENISFWMNWVDMKEEDVSDRQFYLFGSDGIKITFVGEFNKSHELRELSKKVFDESSSNFKIGDKFVDDTHENFGKIYTITSLGVDSYDLEDVNGTQVTRDANYIGTNMHMASKEEIEKTQFAPTMESRMNEGLVDFLKGAGSGVKKIVSGGLKAGDTFTILSSSGREFEGKISNMDDTGRYCVSVTKDNKIVNPFKPCELLTIVTNDGDVLKARSLSYDRDSKCCIINTINKNDIRTHEPKKK